MTNPVREAHTDDEIARCFRVVRQLRPHLQEDQFVPIVRRQQAGGYRIAWIEEEEAG